MSINIKGCSGKTYSFDGPYSNTNPLEDRSGVYVILCNNGTGNTVIDVGESATVKTRIDSHDRKNCWNNNCSGTLKCCVYYTPNLQQHGRMEVEQDIRCFYRPICGKR